MSAKKQKYYVVWHGHRPGIYSTWESCQAQVKNFPNAVYKSFETKAEAEKAYRQAPIFKKKAIQPKVAKSSRGGGKFSWESVSVDAACSWRLQHIN